jgi:hypothetical protein
MPTVAPVSSAAHLLDTLRPRSWRLRAIERDAVAYLGRLFEVNTARIKNDFVDRIVESRRGLEQELRDRLRELGASAARALETARQTQAAGTAALKARLEWLDDLGTAIEGLRSSHETGRRLAQGD